MNSLLELNNYNNSFTFTITDNRLAKVIFNTNVFNDREIVINSTAITVEPTFDITEIIKYSTADCKFRITITSNSPAFVSGSSIVWASLPAHVTLSQSGGVYTLSGLRTVQDWNQVKNPTWNIPANWATVTRFWIKVAVVYYDESLALTLDREIDIFDRDHYPVTQLISEFNLTASTNYNTKTSANLNAVGYLFCDVSVILGTRINAQFNQTASARIIASGQAQTQTTASLSCDATRVPFKILIAANRLSDVVKVYGYNTLTTNYSELSNFTVPYGLVQQIIYTKNTDLLVIGVGSTKDPNNYTTYSGNNLYGSSRALFYRRNPSSNTFTLVYTHEASDGVFDINDGGTIFSWGAQFNIFSLVYNLSGNLTLTRRGTQDTGIPSGDEIQRKSTHYRLDSTGNIGTSSFSQRPGVFSLYEYTTQNGQTFYRQRPFSTDGGSPPPLFDPLSSFSFYNLQTNSGTPVSGLEWSPTASTLAMCCFTQTRIFNWMQTGGSGTSTQLRLMATISFGSKPKWSPNGTYLALLSDQGQNFTIYKRTNDVYTQLYSTNLGIVKDASWSQDSLKLVITTTGVTYEITRNNDSFTLDTTTDIPTADFVAWRRLV